MWSERCVLMVWPWWVNVSYNLWLDYRFNGFGTRQHVCIALCYRLSACLPVTCPGRHTVPRLHSYRKLTRSQAVARIADRTASQHLWVHVMSSVTWPFDTPYAISYWWSFGTKPLSVTVSEIFNVECNAMVDMTLIRTLNKGQNHSFWYQSISHIRLPIGCQ